MFDLVVRGGTLVTHERIVRADVALSGGKIVAVEAEVSGTSKETLDATGLHLFPGIIDTHVHFNEPGRVSWEGVASGSAALAAGGGTLYADMPLNSDPPLLSAADFDAKKRAAEVSSHTDFALWGGLTPDNVEHLPELAERGVVGFKAFMTHSGIPEFKAADDLTLYRGMVSATSLGLPVAVHAESESLTGALTKELRTRGGTLPRDYLASRPILAETEAVNRALFFAQETGCDLHFVHLSSARAVALVTEARLRGVRATCETCPHYLHFTDEDLERLGAVLKCAPPLRNDNERHALWQSVLRGEIDFVASDHSPSDPELKEREDFFEVWGGISGVQSSLNVLLNHRAEQGLPLQKVAALTATNPAERFRLPGKGRLEPGYDADLCLVDLGAAFTLEKNDLFYKHKLSPYLGETFTGRVVRTLLRGRTIFHDGKLSEPGGRFVRPDTQLS